MASSKMNAGASSHNPGGAGTEFMKFPYANCFAPLASLRKLKSGSLDRKFVLQQSDDADAILGKLLDFAVEVGFDRDHARMLLEEGFPRFFYFVLLSEVDNVEMRVDEDLIELMKGSLVSHADWDTSLKRRWGIFITSRSTWNSAPQVANTFKFIFAPAVPAVLAVPGGAAEAVDEVDEVAATQGTSTQDWKTHMKEYFGIVSSDGLNGLTAAEWKLAAYAACTMRKNKKTQAGGKLCDSITCIWQ